MLSKDKLKYDGTTPSNGDSVAAFLHASLKLTSTTVSGKEALDVNVVSDISVDLDGVYDAGDNPTPDTIGFIGHTRAATPDETGQVERITVGAANADDVVAANVHGMDVNGFMMGFDGTTWDRLRATTGRLEVMPFGNVADDAADAGNPIKVGQRAVSGALSAVTTGDRADLLSDLYRRTWVNTAPNVGGANAAITIDDTAGGTALFAVVQAGRRKVEVQNLGDTAIYLGFGAVTAANGIRVAGWATYTTELGPDLALKAIAETGATNDVRVLQLA